MQTPKSKAGPIEVPSRTSPKAPRAARQPKTPGSGSEPVFSSPSKSNRTNKDQNPIVIDRKTPQSPISEKKRQSKALDLENQIAQLHEDLKQTKDKMISSDLLKEQAEQEAEEAKRQLSAVAAKLADTEKQLVEKSQTQEHCKISDGAWESELEAAQKQHSVGSADPFSALNDIHKLKSQPDVEAESEPDADQFITTDSAHDEFQTLQLEHEKTVATVEKLGVELSDCKKSEAQVLEKLENTLYRLEAAMEENETLKRENLNVVQHYNTIASKLEDSNAKVGALEIHVSKLRSELVTCGGGENGMKERSAGAIQQFQENGQNEEIAQLKMEIMNLKCEDSKLRAGLEAAERRYQEVRRQSTLEIKSASDQAESAKVEFKSKEAEMEAEVKKAESFIKELQATLVECESRLQAYAKQELLNNAEDNERKQLEFHLRSLQEALLDKENSLQAVEKENEILKKELQKWEMENSNVSDVDTLAEARAAEQKAVSKFEYLTEESDKNSKRTAHVIEQLEAAQAANSELESELRKLKVQSDQWRKAAEAAAAMLTSGNNNGKYIDRTGSLDSSYHTPGGRISSPFSDDLNEESAKKKNGTIMKKIGVLWKKGQNPK